MAPSLLVRAARGEVTEQIPIWLMRQAGRYLPEFHTVRSQSDFLTVCKTPKLSAELTIQPYTRFGGINGLSACIVFSDILTIPAAMGQNLTMIKGEGPKLTPRLENPAQMDTLNLTPNVHTQLGYVGDAIRESISLLRAQHPTENVPVIGFSGAPWTLFTYMVEGGGSRHWTESRAWLYKHPAESKKLLSAITEIVIEYLIMQIDAGASLIQIFDTNAGELPPSVYEEFCVDDLLYIASELKRQRPDCPLICFPKDCTNLAPFNESHYDVIGISWKTDAAIAREMLPSKVLQGNLDPAVMYAGDAVICEKVGEMIKKFGKEKYIANLGHGMMPDMNPSMVESFIKGVVNAQ